MVKEQSRQLATWKHSALYDKQSFERLMSAVYEQAKAKGPDAITIYIPTTAPNGNRKKRQYFAFNFVRLALKQGANCLLWTGKMQATSTLRSLKLEVSIVKDPGLSISMQLKRKAKLLTVT